MSNISAVLSCLFEQPVWIYEAKVSSWWLLIFGCVSSPSFFWNIKGKSFLLSSSRDSFLEIPLYVVRFPLLRLLLSIIILFLQVFPHQPLASGCFPKCSSIWVWGCCNDCIITGQPRKSFRRTGLWKHDIWRNREYIVSSENITWLYEIYKGDYLPRDVSCNVIYHYHIAFA